MVRPKKLGPALTPDEIAAAKQAGERAMKRVLGQDVREILKNVTEADLIAPNPNSDAVKGTANAPGGWLHAPANLELFASADRGLTTVGNAEDIPGKKMDRVKARLVPGTQLLILKGAHPKDLSALPVNRWPSTSGAWINLFTLLAEAGLTVETGWRERYDVAFVEEDSPLWPALVIDLSQPLERRAEPRSKKKPNAQKKSDKPGTNKETSDEEPVAASTQDQDAAEADTESK